MNRLEDEIQQLIRIEASKIEVSVFRNNSGALADKTGRQVRYGLGNDSKSINQNLKSSDLIGITPIKITSDMVGQTLGVFTAIEIKKESWTYKGDKREIAQKNFIDFILSKGGFAGFANSLESFRKIVRK